jgi:hypothetical protein
VPAGKGQTHVAHFGKVTYKDIYPGIDIEFMLDAKAEGVGYKYNVVVNPGANLSQVKLKVLGAQDLGLNDKGNLVYKTSIGNIEESVPYSYTQNKEGSKQQEKVFYDLHSKESFGFSSNANTNESKLLVDPIGWATYFGLVPTGAPNEGCGISAVNNYSIINSGHTSCSSLIATAGAFIGSYQLGGDFYLTKFSVSGSQIWGTYYGGANAEDAGGLDLDSN